MDEIGKLGSILQRMQRLADEERYVQQDWEELAEEVSDHGTLESYIHSMNETHTILDAFEAKLKSVDEQKCEAWLAPLLGELMSASSQLKKGITEHEVERLGKRIVCSQRSKEA